MNMNRHLLVDESNRTVAGVMSWIVLTGFIGLVFLFRSSIKEKLMQSSAAITTRQLQVLVFGLMLVNFIFITIAMGGLWLSGDTNILGVDVSIEVGLWESCGKVNGNSDCDNTYDNETLLQGNGNTAIGFTQFFVIMSFLSLWVPAFINLAIFVKKMTNLRYEISAYVYLVIMSYMFIAMVTWAGLRNDLLEDYDYEYAYGFCILSWMSAVPLVWICWILYARAERGEDQGDMPAAKPASAGPSARTGGQAPPVQYVTDPQLEDQIQGTLPPNWTAHVSDEGDTYYHNSVTGESSWEFPSA